MSHFVASLPLGIDKAIGGHAIAAVLVTNSSREFERVQGVVLKDWAKYLGQAAIRRPDSYSAVLIVLIFRIT